MLQMIRQIGVEKRWVYGIVMGFVILAFVGTMGWMGMSGPGGVYAAKVNGDEVLVAEFQRNYQRSYEQMSRAYGEQFNEELVKAMGLKRQVLNDMIDRRLWLDWAKEQGLRVGDQELKSAILDSAAFQVNNRFSASHYKRLLTRNNLTPEGYEAAVRDDLMVNKAQGLIRTSAVVTESDMLPYKGLDLEETEALRAKTDEIRRVGLLRVKQSQAVTGFSAYLRGQAVIELFPEAIKSLPG